MKDLLKEGDVIFLKKGMEVYADIPEKYVYSNRQLSNKLTTHDMTVGEYHSSNPDITKERQKIANDIIESFDTHLGVKLKNDDALDVLEFVKKHIPAWKTDTFILDEGEFVVTKTSFSGGGTGMGDHDVYPSGHHVYCQRLNADGTFNEKGTKVSFYQSGCFTAMIYPKQLKVIRQLKKNFS